jgi:hypothetical protein
MSANPKVNGMYRTPQRLRKAVRRAVSFGKSYPLPARATPEVAKPERASSAARWRPMSPAEVLGIQGLGTKFKPTRLLRARIAVLRGSR